MRCPSCGAVLPDGANMCGHCGAGPFGPPPAHRAVVSSEGERSPAPPQPGWMELLEQARRSAPEWIRESAASTTPITEQAHPEASTAPPPLPQKPAHRLIAQLERTPPKPQPPVPVDEIAEAKIEVPSETPSAPKRGWRDAVWVALLVLLVGTGLGFAYILGEEAPVPKAEIDPELTARRARLARARAALEEGHRLAREGPTRADEAIAAYQRALTEEPDLASAHRGLAIVQTGKGRKAAAVEHYRRYLELKPAAQDAAQVRKIIAEWESRRR